VLRRLYDWLIELSGHRHALPTLAGVSFVESSFFPIPPDAMLVPMVLARPDQAWRIALVCSVASVLGGFLGYAIGYYAYETLGKWIVDLYGYGTDIEEYREAYREWGLWIILIKGMTPIPYKLVTIASGLAAFDIWVFMAASIVTRGVRFFLVAALLRAYGEPIRIFVEKYLTLVTTAFLLLIVVGVVAARYLV
jgi:membrane protein YqaA with SNARE-associated domain